MGQKVSPHGLRVGIIKDWSSKWYANKQNFADYLAEDNKIRNYLKNTLKSAGISSINIERKGTEIKVNLATAKPGMIIGNIYYLPRMCRLICWTSSNVALSRFTFRDYFRFLVSHFDFLSFAYFFIIHLVGNT